MADLKISALTSATTPLAGTEVLPIVQSSTTVKVATNDLTVRNVRAAATTGILQVSGPSAAATRTMTVPDANFTAARTDAGQTFTGNQVITSSSTSILTLQTTGTSGQEVDFKIVATNSDASSNQWKIATNVAADNEFLIYDTTNSQAVDRYIRGASGYRRIFVNGNAVANFSPAGDQTLYLGNLVIGTSGKGIDFSATPGTGTSELLADYEEGTWTPSLGGTATYSSRTATYTKIGRVVHVFCDMTVNTIGTGSTSTVSGLPYNPADFGGALSVGYFTSLATSVINIQLRLNAASSDVTVQSEIISYTASGSNAIFQNGTRFTFSGTYNI